MSASGRTSRRASVSSNSSATSGILDDPRSAIIRAYSRLNKVVANNPNTANLVKDGIKAYHAAVMENFESQERQQREGETLIRREQDMENLREMIRTEITQAIPAMRTEPMETGITTADLEEFGINLRASVVEIISTELAKQITEQPRAQVETVDAETKEWFETEIKKMREDVEEMRKEINNTGRRSENTMSEIKLGITDEIRGVADRIVPLTKTTRRIEETTDSLLAKSSDEKGLLAKMDDLKETLQSRSPDTIPGPVQGVERFEETIKAIRIDAQAARTYAQRAAKGTNRAPPKDENESQCPAKNQVIITPKEGVTRSEAIRRVRKIAEENEIVKEVTRCRPWGQRGFLLECRDETTVLKINEKVRAADMGVVPSKRNFPRKRFIMLSVEHEVTKEALHESIISSETFKGLGTTCDKEEIKVEFKLTGSENRPQGRFVISAPAPIQEALVTRGSIDVGWVRHQLRDYSTPTRCLRCNDFGHMAAKCEKDVACGHCAGAHRSRECKTENDRKCVNCRRSGADDAHDSYSRDCPAYRRALELARNRNG